MTTHVLTLPVQRLPHADGLPLPAYQTAGSAGMDLIAAVPENAPIELAPMARVLVPTGLAMALPLGFEGQVRPRSGLAVKQGITVLNSPGTIDSDYRGELKVLLINMGGGPFMIRRGDRIAQLIIASCVQFTLTPVEVLDDTNRGTSGFGSTGRN